VVLFSFICEGI